MDTYWHECEEFLQGIFGYIEIIFLHFSTSTNVVFVVQFCLRIELTTVVQIIDKGKCLL